MDIERRFLATELRATEDGVIEGYAAVFNELSVDLGGFREFIRPGAFAMAIQEDDVRALWNHDSSFVLGRSKSGTLELSEDKRGLRIKVTPPDAQWARDLRESIRRGDVDQMSFAFATVEDKWERTDGQSTRELIQVRLFDVSPVTFPAYEGTSVSARALTMVEQLSQGDSTPDDAEGGQEGEGTQEERDLQAQLENQKRLVDITAKELLSIRRF